MATVFYLSSFDFPGDTVKVRVQAEAHRPPDQAHPAAHQVPHASRGHSQAQPEGGPRRRGPGHRQRIPRHDRRAQPGQRHDGHRQAAGLRGRALRASLPAYVTFALSLQLCPSLDLNWQLADVEEILRRHLLNISNQLFRGRLGSKRFYSWHYCICLPFFLPPPPCPLPFLSFIVLSAQGHKTQFLSAFPSWA